MIPIIVRPRTFVLAALLALALTLALIALAPAPALASTGNGSALVSTAALEPADFIDLGEVAWRFQEGDSPEWANPEFDDSSWALVDPVKPPATEGTFWQGIGWFRLHLEVEGILENTSLALSLYHLGASEIWIDGRLVGGHGTIGSGQTADAIYAPKGLPTTFTLTPALTPARSHLIAIRFSNRSIPTSTMMAHRENVHLPAGPHVLIGRAQQFIPRYVNAARSLWTEGLIMGVLGLLSFVHLLLYALDRRDRANLWFGLSTGILTIAVIHGGSVGRPELVFDGSANGHIVSWLIMMTGFPAFFVLLWAAVRELFGRRKIRWAWLALASLVVAVLYAGLWMLEAELASQSMLAVFWAPAWICLLDAVRISMWAVWRREDDAWVIGLGALLTLVAAFTGFNIGAFVSEPGLWLAFQSPQLVYPYLLGMVFLVLPVPLAMSAHLSLRFQRRRRQLELELRRVEELQEQTIRQEVERARLQEEDARKSAELEEAREVQLSMLPERIPVIPGWEVAAAMQTATEVGGDYYDAHVRSDGTATLALGDATGHGLKAGLMVAATKSLFIAEAPRDDVGDSLSRMSNAIRGMRLPHLAMCLAICRIEGRELRYSSAGIPPLWIQRAADGRVEEILAPGLPLGTMSDVTYAERRIEVQPGDVVVLMSDGLPECVNGAGDLLGYERPKRTLQRLSNRSASDILAGLLAEADQWLDGGALDDDRTMLVLRYMPD